MDADTEDLPRADVEIGGGVIQRIGVDLRSHGEARVIDAAGAIVLRGSWTRTATSGRDYRRFTVMSTGVGA